MTAYSPTDLQREIRDAFRAEKLGVPNMSTDQQIFDAVSYVVANPHPSFPNDIMLWTRVKLCRDFAAGVKKLKLEEAAA